MQREVTVKLEPGQFAVVVHGEAVGQYRVWSEPLQLMVEPSRDGDHDVLEMTMRRHECPSLADFR